MGAPGATTFQLVDEDGDDLAGAWTFEWEDHDPFDVVVNAVEMVSGRPWKWSARKRNVGRLSAKKCRILRVRVGNVLRAKNRARCIAALVRAIADERARRESDVDRELVARYLDDEKGRMPADTELECAAPLVLHTLARALNEAVECEGGLRVERVRR